VAGIITNASTCLGLPAPIPKISMVRSFLFDEAGYRYKIARILRTLRHAILFA
jgi:hypothetical protein